MAENNQIATQQQARAVTVQNMLKVGAEIDRVIAETLPVSSRMAENVVQDLTIASGVRELELLLQNSREIQAVIMHMANSELGFMTDRMPGNYQGKPPYTFQELLKPVIVGLLKGYRISGNEMNVISGRFYAAKAGSFRRVIQWPGLTDFKYGNSPVQHPENGASYARVKTWATWKLNGKESTIGIEAHDDCTFQVRVNKAMGEDAIIGKAHSKLFRRVLERISGQSMPESTEIDPADFAEAEVINSNNDPLADAPDRRPIDLGPGLQQGQGRYNGSNSQPPDDLNLDGTPKTTPSPATPPPQEAQPAETENAENDQNSAENDQNPAENVKAGNWWDALENWINRRSTPFLYLVRVGLGLPHVDQELTTTDGDTVKMQFVAAYEKELRECAGAFGALLDAAAATVERLEKKLAGMGHPDLLLRWRRELSSQGNGGQRKEEKPATRTHSFNGVVISLPDGLDIAGEVAHAWKNYQQGNPDILAKVVGRLGPPETPDDVQSILNIVETTVTYGDQAF